METKTIRELSEQIRQAMDQLRTGMREKIEQADPLDGVKVMGPQFGTVTYQAIMASPGHILAPSYYLPGVQAKAVSGYLLKENLTFEQIEARLEEVITSRSVTYEKEKIYLNPNTLAVLQDLQREMQET